MTSSAQPPAPLINKRPPCAERLCESKLNKENSEATRPPFAPFLTCSQPMLMKSQSTAVMSLEWLQEKAVSVPTGLCWSCFLNGLQFWVLLCLAATCRREHTNSFVYRNFKNLINLSQDDCKVGRLRVKLWAPMEGKTHTSPKSSRQFLAQWFAK